MESCCRLMSPLPFPVFSAPTCKGGVDGSVPFLLLLAKVYFAPRLAPSPWMPAPPHPNPGAMWEPSFLQHLRNKSDTLQTAAYSEAGGWGIRWNKWHSWQVFSRLVKKERERERDWRREVGKGGGCCFWRGEGVFIFKRTRIEWEIPPCVKYLESVSVCCW